MAQTKLTPMFEQYLRIKGEYPDALLFYRMGDFYELFFEDAEIAARELQIALTSRNPNADLKVPMCGVPHHASDEYLSQLLAKGYKVAVCEQVEDPREAKGLVKREVTRVLTPGTVVEDSNLHSKSHNFLAALCWDNQSGRGGAAWVDFSTGEWSGLFSRQSQELWQWIGKINPREMLLPQGAPVPSDISLSTLHINSLPFQPYFDPNSAREKVLGVQKISSLEPLDLEEKKELLQACGALVTYLLQTQKLDSIPLGMFKPLNIGKHLILDEVTEKNLELFQRLDGRKGPGTLLHVLDNTMTPMGGRLLTYRLKHPWRNQAPVQEYQDSVTFFFQQEEIRDNVRNALDSVYDLERLTTRIQLNRCTPKDFIALRETLRALPAVQSRFGDVSRSNLPKIIKSLLNTWDNLEDVAELLESSLVDSPPPLITEGGLFRTGYDDVLDEYIELAEHGEEKMQTMLKNEQKLHELPKLKLGYNRVFGYYLELTKAHKGHVPEHFVRRQTLANSERYITQELKELEERLLSASEKRKNYEYELFQDVRKRIAGQRERIMKQAVRVGEMDYLQCLSHTARKWDWNPPQVHSGLSIEIKAGRHPSVEAVQGRADYIPNDLHLDDRDRVLIITGPNMAGKSTVLRQTALISILAQIGSYVPAQKASIGLSDRIFSRVGASDNLAQGQSTFMVEMIETARILRQAGKRSLVILDEIGRGTSTFDGLALAWAVVEDLSGKGEGGIRTLFATHYHELTDLEGTLSGVKNYNIAVKEWKGDIVFLRRLVPGPADRSYGIEVAKLAGVPQNVVRKAKEILGDLEQKAHGLRKSVKPETSCARPFLPGLAAQSAENTADHPILEELYSLDVLQLTPLQAMNVLNQWKEKWGMEDEDT